MPLRPRILLIATGALLTAIGVFLFSRPDDPAQQSLTTTSRPPTLPAEGGLTRLPHLPTYPAEEAPTSAAALADLKRAPRSALGELLRKSTTRQRHDFFVDLGRTDFELGMELAEEMIYPLLYRGKVLFGYAQVAPVEALTWARQHAFLEDRSADVEPKEDAGVKQRLIRDSAGGAFVGDPAGFSKLIQTHGRPEELSDFSKGLVHLTAVTGNYEQLFAHHDAVALVLQYHSPETLQGMAAEWGRKQPTALTTFLKGVPYGNALHEPLLAAVATQYAAVNPQDAIDWALTQDANYGYAVTSRALYEFVQQSKDPLAVLEWLATRPGVQPAQIDAALLHVSRVVNKKDFHQGLALAAQIVDPAPRAQALRSIKLVWQDDAQFQTYVAGGGPLTKELTASP